MKWKIVKIFYKRQINNEMLNLLWYGVSINVFRKLVKVAICFDNSEEKTINTYKTMHVEFCLIMSDLGFPLGESSTRFKMVWLVFCFILSDSNTCIQPVTNQHSRLHVTLQQSQFSERIHVHNSSKYRRMCTVLSLSFIISNTFEKQIKHLWKKE